MKKLYCDNDWMRVAYLKDALEHHGIECLVKNEYLAGAMGEIPPLECWPELWVLDPERIELARRLMRSLLVETDKVTEGWRCTECGERSEGQFTECWRCCASR
jgi:Putative prokaryotic signal transducing protein